MITRVFFVFFDYKIYWRRRRCPGRGTNIRNFRFAVCCFRIFWNFFTAMKSVPRFLACREFTLFPLRNRNSDLLPVVRPIMSTTAFESRTKKFRRQKNVVVNRRALRQCVVDDGRERSHRRRARATRKIRKFFFFRLNWRPSARHKRVRPSTQRFVRFRRRVRDVTRTFRDFGVFSFPPHSPPVVIGVIRTTTVRPYLL